MWTSLLKSGSRRWRTSMMRAALEGNDSGPGWFLWKWASTWPAAAATRIGSQTGATGAGRGGSAETTGGAAAVALRAGRGGDVGVGVRDGRRFANSLVTQLSISFVG